LERKDVNPDHADTFGGRTPLSWAARGGHEGVVKILLERKDVNPDHADTYGQTPLSLAAQGGHEGVVKMLLERKDVSPDRADTEYGRTPLSFAAERGHEGVVKILLERNDVNPAQADTEYGRTPLSWAAQAGHEEIVKLLLERKDVDPDQADSKCGRTPLSWAEEGGHEGVVKMLLERKDVNPDQAGTRDSRAPLPASRRQEVVDVFEPNDVRTAMPEDQSQAPPPSTPPKSHDGAANILLELDNANSNILSHGVPSSLPPPAQPLDRSPVGMQFTSHDSHSDATDSNRQPPLPPEHSDEPEQVLDPKNPASTSPDNELPAAKPSLLPEAASPVSLNFQHLPRESATHPNNTLSALPIVLNRYWVIGFCVCIFAFVAYSKNSHN